MTSIKLSIFDIFKIGPGPSSSHTIAPMKAGYDFSQEASRLSQGVLKRAEKIEVRLYGSLSATGEGHGTDVAVVAGLMGNPPETCSTELIDRLHSNKGQPIDPIVIGNKAFHIAVKDVIYDKVQHDFPFSNTLVIRLLEKDARRIFEKEYYSVGGGFLQWKGWIAPERGEPVYGFSSAIELGKVMEESGVSSHDALMQNEKAITGASEDEINSGIDLLLDAMEASVEGGLDAEGLLPGPLKVQRNAGYLYRNSCVMDGSAGRFIAMLSAYALAPAEENAAGHRIVTAPYLRCRRRDTGGLLSDETQSQDSAQESSTGIYGGCGCRLPLQGKCKHCRRRGRLPGRDRCRHSHGGRHDYLRCQGRSGLIRTFRRHRSGTSAGLDL